MRAGRAGDAVDGDGYHAVGAHLADDGSQGWFKKGLSSSSLRLEKVRHRL